MSERFETEYQGNKVEISASWLAPLGIYEVVVWFNPDGGSRHIGHKTMNMSPVQWDGYRQQFVRRQIAQQPE